MKGKDDGYKVFFSNSYADPDIGSGNADDIGGNRGKRGYECQLHPLLVGPEELTLYEVYQAVSETEQVHVFDLHQNPNDQCIVGKHIKPVLTDVFRSIEEKAERELRNTTLRDCMDRMQDEIERSL